MRLASFAAAPHRAASSLMLAVLAATSLAAACKDSTSPDPLLLTTSPATVACTVGQTQTIALSATGGTTAPTFSLTASNASVSVAGNGGFATVTCASAGTSTITVTATSAGQTVTATVAVIVSPAPALAITLSQPAITCSAGQSVPLGVAIAGAQNGGTPTVTFSSSGPAATAAASGGGATVTCAAQGSADITVSAVSGPQSGTAIVRVTVGPPAPLAISLAPAQLTCTAGQTVTVNATIAGSNSGNPTVTFTSSDPARASVSSIGTSATVRCVTSGSATITVAAADGQQRGTASVLVAIAPAQLGITLSPTALSCVPGQSVSLTANLNVDPNNPQTVTFATTSPNVALTFAGNTATVQCMSAGSGTITATTTSAVGTGSATASVTVATPVASVVLAPTAAQLAPGATIVLTPIVTLRTGAGSTTSTAVRYSTSDATVATVATNANGLATVSIVNNLANIGQQVTITATSVADPTAQGTTTITVLDPLNVAAKVVLTTTGLVLNSVGDTATIGATVTLSPNAPAGTSRSVTFVSSDPTIATVTPAGFVVARAPGTATITVASVAAPTVTAAVIVTVAGTGTGTGTPTPSTGVSLQVTSLSTRNGAGQVVPANTAAISGPLVVALSVNAGAFRVDSVVVVIGPARFPCFGALVGVNSGFCTVDTGTRDVLTTLPLVPNGAQPLSLVAYYHDGPNGTGNSLTATYSYPFVLVINNP